MKGITRYTYGFDGEDFVEYNEELNRYMTNSNVVLLSDGTKVMNARSIYESICKIDINYNNYQLPKIDRYNGVAGCGKTKKAIDIVKLYPDKCIVLTATRSAANDLRTRISEVMPDAYTDKELKMRFRTLDSLLVCIDAYKNTYFGENKYTIMIIDECYMMNLGGLLSAVNLSDVDLVICIGDKYQLPYIERDRMVYYGYDDLDQVSNLKDVFNVSSRCPADVCSILNSPYRDGGMKGMLTTNNIKNSITIKSLCNMKEIEHNVDKNTVVLTFKQEEKQELINKLSSVNALNCFTIHEFQGQTRENIILIRLSHLEMDEIYTSKSHQLVALTRHTKKYIYYTMKNPDSLTKRIIGSCNDLTININDEDIMERDDLPLERSGKFDVVNVDELVDGALN